MKRKFELRGMHCVACAMTIDGAVEDLAGVQSATTSYARQCVDVEYDEKKVTERDIVIAIEEAGYQAEPKQSHTEYQPLLGQSITQ